MISSISLWKAHAVTFSIWGGGCGAYAQALINKGLNVTLAEIDPSCVGAARVLGVPALLVSDEFWNSGRRYDTVILVEVLEHVDDPKRFLSQVMSVARKKVLLTVPCNDDFPLLFKHSITYNHIAVSDHLHHFTSQEIENLVHQLGYTARIRTGAFLFPRLVIDLVRELIPRGIFAAAAVFPLRLLFKLRLVSRRIPTRIFVEIELEK